MKCIGRHPNHCVPSSPKRVGNPQSAYISSPLSPLSVSLSYGLALVASISLVALPSEALELLAPDLSKAAGEMREKARKADQEADEVRNAKMMLIKRR